MQSFFNWAKTTYDSIQATPFRYVNGDEIKIEYALSKYGEILEEIE